MLHHFFWYTYITPNDLKIGLEVPKASEKLQLLFEGRG